MADHQQSSEAVAKAAAAAAYPPKVPKRIADSMAFIDEILPELLAAPDILHEFLRLLSGLGKDGGDAFAVGYRAAELLRGHPDVLRRFTAHVHMDVPEEEGLALTRPRRSGRRSERRDTQQQTPAAAPPEAPPNVVAAARNKHGDDRGLRLADAAQALAFVKRVHETAGPVVHDRFLAVLSEAKGSEDMFADEIYDMAKRAFGPAHVGLLHAFATVWLPGEQEWKLQQARGPAARQRTRAPAASASHAGVPDAKKKPRAADDDDGNARRHDPAAIAPRRQRNRAAASSQAAAGMPPDAKKPRADDGDNSRQHDHVIAVLEVRNVKKRRSDDDGTGRGHDALRITQSSGGGAAPQGRDYDYDYAPRSRAKKSHSGNGEFSFSGSAAAARVLGADATGVHHANSDNDKKPPRRRAASGGKSSSLVAAAGPKQQPERDDEVWRFRQEWEFQTYYSKLVATSDRVMELLRPTRTRTPHGDGGGGNRSLEALFPLSECREFLRNCYGVRWGEMRAALERGESRVPALEAIERRLTRKEEQAVAEELRKRCRHDPVRVAQRLHGLAMDTLDEECRRHYGGGA